MRKATCGALLLLGLCAMPAGCGGAPDGPGGPVMMRHGPPVSINLTDWRYVPTGTGLRSSAGAAGGADGAVHYGMALRTAALKLVGELPTLEQIMRMDEAMRAGRNDGSDLDPQALYGRYVQGYLDDTPRFARQMMQYWRDTLRMGGTIRGLVANSSAMATVDLEPAPRFAARLSVEGKDMRLLFTQDRDTCPSYTAATGVFANGSCQAASGITEGNHAGILTHPAFLAQYYGSMAFRRVRLVQEVFACHKFPVEFARSPQLVDGALYISPWPQGSITSAAKPPTYVTRQVRNPNTATTPRNSTIPIANYRYMDFATVCSGCHATINRIAPLFIGFDGTGFLRATPMVQVPIDDNPFVQLVDYLPADDQRTYWRLGVEAPTLKKLGEAIAADPEVAKCFVKRAWNHAFSRADIVDDLAVVPDSVVADITAAFVRDSYNLKRMLYAVYTHPSFIRF